MNRELSKLKMKLFEMREDIRNEFLKKADEWISKRDFEAYEREVLIMNAELKRVDAVIRLINETR